MLYICSWVIDSVAGYYLLNFSIIFFLVSANIQLIILKLHVTTGIAIVLIAKTLFYIYFYSYCINWSPIE